MRRQTAALLLMLGTAFHANARSYATIHPWGNTVVGECEWWNMPKGCDRDRVVNPHAEQTFYTAPPGTPSTMAPLETTSEARETRSEIPQTTVKVPEHARNSTTGMASTTTSGASETTFMASNTTTAAPETRAGASVSTSSLPTGMSNRPSTIVAVTTSSSMVNTTSSMFKTARSGVNTTSTTFKTTSSPSMTTSSISSTPNTTSSTAPSPPPPPPNFDPFKISLKHCSGARTNDALHCTGACRDVTLTCNDASKGCLVGPETPAECIETDGKQLIDVCDRHRKGGAFLLGIFGLVGDPGDGSCHGLDEWTSIGIRNDGTHVYNTPKTKRIRV